MGPFGVEESKMKLFVFVAVCVFAAVSAKQHPIKIKQTCNNPMVEVSNVFAEGGGTLDKHSVIHMDVNADTDTRRFDPFDQMLVIKLYKWVLFGWVKVPDPVMRIACHKVEKARPGKVSCLKDGKVLVHCMLDEVTGHCLPVKGKSHLTVHMIPTFQGASPMKHAPSSPGHTTSLIGSKNKWPPTEGLVVVLVFVCLLIFVN